MEIWVHVLLRRKDCINNSYIHVLANMHTMDIIYDSYTVLLLLVASQYNMMCYSICILLYSSQYVYIFWSIHNIYQLEQGACAQMYQVYRILRSMNSTRQHYFSSQYHTLEYYAYYAYYAQLVGVLLVEYEHPEFPRGKYIT